MDTYKRLGDRERQIVVTFTEDELQSIEECKRILLELPVGLLLTLGTALNQLILEVLTERSHRA